MAVRQLPQHSSTAGKKIRTFPYHPASNDLIETWHCTLKSSITCHEDGKQWLDLLLIVLLDLRTCLKEDLKCSPVELVYENTETFVMTLCKRIRQLRPQSTHHHGKRTAFRQQRIEQSIHVFVRKDGVRKTFQHLYTGPHEVIRRENEYIYVIHMNGHNVALSTEKLKLAFLPKYKRST
ncbi:PREDICTED: uncharacterized protein LOC105152041 [Acromyrmex echinatior]|uniref:uncharacterized protein LOC105152041 n=1 Tax=Acromyrmex echinatior TaxID=103372 RepID=UPI000580E2B8|nr:PREDICTED: uncharacterized protein LOC105152041 [Acromyrmex echinatior]